jgi:hypothetical protein
MWNYFFNIFVVIDIIHIFNHNNQLSFTSIACCYSLSSSHFLVKDLWLFNSIFWFGYPCIICTNAHDVSYLLLYLVFKKIVASFFFYPFSPSYQVHKIIINPTKTRPPHSTGRRLCAFCLLPLDIYSYRKPMLSLHVFFIFSLDLYLFKLCAQWRPQSLVDVL